MRACAHWERPLAAASTGLNKASVLSVPIERGLWLRLQLVNAGVPIGRDLWLKLQLVDAGVPLGRYLWLRPQLGSLRPVYYLLGDASGSGGGPQLVDAASAPLGRYLWLTRPQLGPSVPFWRDL